MTTSIHPNLGGLFIAQTPILNHTKLDMHKQKNKGGRPQKITNTVLRKLEGAFIDGMTDKEAAYLADIAPSTLYEYCKLHPAFSERKEVLKHHPTIAAKRVVIKAINKASGDDEAEEAEEAPAEPSEEVKLLTEIRDNLRRG